MSEVEFCSTIDFITLLYICTSVYSLLPSHATILTLSTRANSCTSRNSTSFSINVQTLSQNRYVFNLAALNVTRALTFWLSAVFIDLSNCKRTLSASWGVIWPNFKVQQCHSLYHDIQPYKYQHTRDASKVIPSQHTSHEKQTIQIEKLNYYKINCWKIKWLNFQWDIKQWLEISNK